MLLGIAADPANLSRISRRCVVGSAWRFSAPILFQNRFMKMWSTGCAYRGVRDRRVLNEACERALRAAALWSEVKD